MSDRRIENARTLASLLDIGTDEAARLLEITIAVTFDHDAQAAIVAVYLAEILGRTVSCVTLNGDCSRAVAEIVVGAAPARCERSVRLQITSDFIEIGGALSVQPLDATAHRIVLLVAACYAAGAGLRLALPGLVVSAPSIGSGLTIPLATILGSDRSWLSRNAVLTDMYLAGAGAVGNGFLYALATLQVTGTLTIVDPDTVSDGNLNRCVWFTEMDVGSDKAVRLAEYASPRLAGLTLKPHVSTLQALGKQQTHNRWLRRLIVGVDSRRTRRRLQSEIPLEVFDASTTGIAEIVLHHHLQPTDLACLACIYHETANELAHESHMAEVLGVELADIKQHFVSVEAAQKIHARYPDTPSDNLQGQAYDSVFKALCSEGRLLSSENRQVLAPFAFVSVLAGAYLAIEVCRRTVFGSDSQEFNYWRVSPWTVPVGDLKQIRERNEACEFCGSQTLLKVAKQLWDTERGTASALDESLAS